MFRHHHEAPPPDKVSKRQYVPQWKHHSLFSSDATTAPAYAYTQIPYVTQDTTHPGLIFEARPLHDEEDANFKMILLPKRYRRESSNAAICRHCFSCPENRALKIGGGGVMSHATKGTAGTNTHHNSYETNPRPAYLYSDDKKCRKPTTPACTCNLIQSWQLTSLVVSVVVTNTGSQ